MAKPIYIYHKRGHHHYRQAEDGSVLHLLYVEDRHAIVNKITAREMLLANMEDRMFSPMPSSEAEFNHTLDLVKAELGIA